MWFLAAVVAHAQALTWDSVTDIALEAFADGPGVATSHRIEGRIRASRAAAVPVTVTWEQQAGLASQDQVTVAAAIPLDLGFAATRSWRRDAERLEAVEASERLAFVLEVQEAYLERWTAAALLDHLTHYAEEVETHVAAMEAAAGSDAVAAIEIEDLRAESAHAIAERVAVSHDLLRADARLQALLGPTEIARDDHVHDLPWPETSPWLALLDAAPRHPDVRALALSARAERARAAALGAEALPAIAAGPMWARGDDGKMAPFAFIGVDLPLRAATAPDRRAARAEASAFDAEAAWQISRVRATLAVEHQGWLALRERLDVLEREVLAPLEARQARLEAAFSEGLVTADRVVRARQQRHEAEHEQIRAAGELLGSTARARAWARVLEETP